MVVVEVVDVVVVVVVGAFVVVVVVVAVVTSPPAPAGQASFVQPYGFSGVTAAGVAAPRTAASTNRILASIYQKPCPVHTFANM